MIFKYRKSIYFISIIILILAVIPNKFNEPIVISSLIKDYKKLLGIIIEKCKDNNEIFIDEEVLKIIN